MKHLILVVMMCGLSLAATASAVGRHLQMPWHRALGQPAKSERWLDANHLRIEVHGVWQDVALMPLADHLCRGHQPLFDRYCNQPGRH